MSRQHEYAVDVVWTGDTGRGYRDYGRDHEVTVTGKPPLSGSADPAFRGDPGRWNPEELLVASLSQCHMLSYLALCALEGIAVVDYRDRARGVMAELPGGSGHFTEVVLRPVVVVADAASVARATELHGRAHEICFVANSVTFPVRHEPSTEIAPPSAAP